MSCRIHVLAVLTATILAACSDTPPATGPARLPAKPALLIDAGVVCNGATMPVIECQALVALYNSTNGPGWTGNLGWGTDPNPCHWSFIACTDGDHGSVSGVFLSENNLSGPIPAALGNLTQAKTIRMAGNQLTGPIPAALGNLASVEMLSLSYNQLTGPIPPELGNLTNVEQLVLGGNAFGGTIPAALGNLANLELLYLPHTQLTGAIPAALGNLGNLKRLVLRNNALTGSIPASFGNLASLDSADLSANQLSGSIPASLGNVAGLRWFDASYNALTGPVPEALTQLPDLFSINLAGNQLSGLVSLSIATFGESIVASCLFAPGNPELYVPDVPTYRAADADGDGTICGLPFASAEDIGEDAIEDIDDLVPGTLNEGQANALKTKIENAMAKAANGQYGAAINQMQAFVTQLNDMVANGTLTPVQAAPFIQQAEWLIAIWSGML